jgi:lipoyl synthase
MSKRPGKFPAWIRRAWPSGEAFREVGALLSDLNLHTVCQSAHCPNHGECWSRRTATFMILGAVCTRNCRFCAVNHGVPCPPDSGEPAHIAEAVSRLGLRHLVITSVTRDDLPDGGASHFAACVQAVKVRCPETTIEVLTPDFEGDARVIGTVLAAGPEVFSHNIETVARLHPMLRDRRYSYARSLEVLRKAAAISGGRSIIKSAFMAGCGEAESEVRDTLGDLLAAGVTAVCIGQYLQPTPAQAPVAAYVAPAVFKAWEQMAYEMGFSFAVAGPFVRSSYRSEAVLAPAAACAQRREGEE